MFRSSLSFLFFLAVLAFVAGFAVTIRDGGELSESEKLDMANEAISGLTAQNEQLRDKVQYFASQLEVLADHQSETKKLAHSRWEILEEFAVSQETQLAEIKESRTEIGKELEHLASEQARLTERSDEKLTALAERFDFGDARMRELAAAQEDFAKLGEKIRSSTAFKKVGTVDLDEIGRALSERIENAMKKRQVLTDDRKEKLNLLKKRRAQLQQLTFEQESVPNSRSGDLKRRILDEAEQVVATAYKKEIVELEREIGSLEIEVPLVVDGINKALQLVLARAEEEYGVVITYQESEMPVVDLTSQVNQMIRQLPDDDPIFSDL